MASMLLIQSISLSPCLAAMLAKFNSASNLWWFLLAVFGGLVLILFVYSIIVFMVDQKRDEAAELRYSQWRASIEANGGELLVREVPIHLQKGEVCYFCDPTAILCEPRAIRKGGVSGSSVSIMRGLSIHSGRYTSESHDEWRKISPGALYVTDKRIIFDGNTKNREIPLSDVMSVAAKARCANVSSHKLQRPIGFASINGQIFADVVNALCPNNE